MLTEHWKERADVAVEAKEGPRVTVVGRAEARRSPLTMASVQRLRSVAGDFTVRAATQKATLLRLFAASPIEDPSALLAYHDCLLYLLAYPQTRTLHAMATDELARVVGEARRMDTQAERSGEAGRGRALEGSGIAWSQVGAQFSFPVARWLVRRYPQHVELGWFEEKATPLATVLRFCLPEMEEEILAREHASSEALLEELTAGAGSRLGWLVAQFERLPAAEPIRDHLFESLGAHLVISPRDSALSRTFVRGPSQAPFCHPRGLLRRVHVSSLLSQALPPPRPLTRSGRTSLVDAGRAILAMLGRETVPISLCEPDGVEYIELGRGLGIAMYWIPPGERPPLDTHVGFVLFKNALPVAYGGGWPFLGLCRIGSYVFEPFRGGESAYLFCQVLRAYAQRFGVQRFLIEPYQFGAGNPEGLDSGAFWFYYRLGFRPVEHRLARLAESEANLMAADRDHRSSRALLRRLTRSDLELVLAGEDGSASPTDPAQLSQAVSDWIGSHFKGDRTEAEQAAVARVSSALEVSGEEPWPEAERRSFRSMSLFVGMIPDLERWPLADRRRLVAIMRAKGARTERRYFQLMRAHRRFRLAVQELGATGSS